MINRPAFLGPLVLAACLLAAGSAERAGAGSGANTRWYGNVNERSAIVREGGVFRVVNRESGYLLYEDGYCRRIDRSDYFVATARKLKSRLIYFCTRALPRSAKWAWTEAEFHLASEGGRDVWRLFWRKDEGEAGPSPSVDARIQAARIVPEYPSFDKVLDGIDCKVSFERIGDGRELVRPNAPFGDCALGDVKAGRLAPGEYACEASVDPTFLARRAVRLISRGDPGRPQIELKVEGRAPKRCTVVPSGG